MQQAAVNFSLRPPDMSYLLLHARFVKRPQLLTPFQRGGTSAHPPFCLRRRMRFQVGHA